VQRKVSMEIRGKNKLRGIHDGNQNMDDYDDFIGGIYYTTNSKFSNKNTSIRRNTIEHYKSNNR